MQKIFLTILAFFASTSIVFGATNLWQFYNEQGLLLPSFEYRKDFYEQILNDDEYKGTVKQNALYLQYLQENEFVEIPKASEIKLGADSQLFVGGTVYYLAGSGITSSAASITLTSLTLPQTGQKIKDSDLSDTFYITIEPGSTARQEFVSCTTVTQNASTATLTGCSRGLSPLSPYTASTTMQFAHSGGSKVIFSNPPKLYDQAAFKGNDESITGLYTFSQNPISTAGNATTSTQLATKSYVDNVTNQGAATSTETNGGIVELGTLAEQANSYSGGADKPTVLQTKNSTSTCQVAGSYNLVASSTTGKLDKNCLDQTLNYSWSGTNNHSGLNTFSNATTSIEGRLGVGTSSPFTSLGVAGTITSNIINATSSNATSTFSGNVVVSNNASTTNLTISNTCAGCLNGYERVTNTGALSTSDNGDTSVSTSCTAGKNVVGGGLSWGSNTGYRMQESYPSSNTAWTGVLRCHSVALGTCNAGTLTVYAICAKP